MPEPVAVSLAVPSMVWPRNRTAPLAVVIATLPSAASTSIGPNEPCCALPALSTAVPLNVWALPSGAVWEAGHVSIPERASVHVHEMVGAVRYQPVVASGEPLALPLIAGLTWSSRIVIGVL